MVSNVIAFPSSPRGSVDLIPILSAWYPRPTQKVVDTVETRPRRLTGAALWWPQPSSLGEDQSFACGIATRREAVDGTGLTSFPFMIYATWLPYSNGRQQERLTSRHEPKS